MEPSRPPVKDDRDRRSMMLGFRILGDFGVIIAAPAVLGALLGKWLDARYGTSPWLLIICIAMAAVCTIVLIVRKAKSYGKEYGALWATKDMKK